MNETVNLSSETVPTDQKVEDKIRVSYGIAIDMSDGGNPYLFSRILYDALYRPREVIANHQIPSSEKFPDRVELLEDEITFGPEHELPNEEEFTSVIVDILTRDREIHQASLYEAAGQTIDALARSGPMIIWTQGDPMGERDNGDKGNAEQLWKIAAGGIGEIRRKIHREESDQMDGDQQRTRSEIIKVVASEDKFSEKSLGSVIDFFEKAQINQVVIIEDRLKNARRLQEFLTRTELQVQVVVVKSGKTKEDEISSPDNNDVIFVDEFSDIPSKLVAENGHNEIGIICDFDGVVSNQKRRSELQRAEITRNLSSLKWV